MNCKVAEKLFEIMHLLWEEQKMPHEYGGQLLYHSEVVFLDMVHRNPQANVSSMSALLKITKGAVTQLAARLLKKGLVDLYTKAGNRKEKYFRLTGTGEAARRDYLCFHESSNRRLCDYVKTLSPDEVRVIFDFLAQLRSCVPFCEFDCMCKAPRQRKEAFQYEPDVTEYSQPACHT